MAQVRLSRDQADGSLPKICLVCGGDATTVEEKSFTWHPPWIWFTLPLGLVPFVIFALAMGQRIKLKAPLCADHQYHWVIRIVMLVIGIIALIVAAFACAAQGSGPIANWCWVGWLTGLIVWVMAMIVLSITAVRPVSITDAGLVLTGVAPAFVEAMAVWDPRPTLGRGCLGPYRLRTSRSESSHLEPAGQTAIQEKPGRGRAPRANGDVSIQDKSKRLTPPDEAIQA